MRKRIYITASIMSIVLVAFFVVSQGFLTSGKYDAISKALLSQRSANGLLPTSRKTTRECYAGTVEKQCPVLIYEISKERCEQLTAAYALKVDDGADDECGPAYGVIEQQGVSVKLYAGVGDTKETYWFQAWLEES